MCRISDTSLGMAYLCCDVLHLVDIPMSIA